MNEMSRELLGQLVTDGCRCPPRPNPSIPDHYTYTIQGMPWKHTEGLLTLRWWPESVFPGFSKMHHFCPADGPRTKSFRGKSKGQCVGLFAGQKWCISGNPGNTLSGHHLDVSSPSVFSQGMPCQVSWTGMLGLGCGGQQ